MDIKQLRETVDHLFIKRGPLLTLWQEIAENFYPERAEFTIKRYLGDDFAGNLMTSYPVQCRRELGDQFGTMLRNVGKPWFNIAPTDPQRETNDAKRWLEWATGSMRRSMYDPVTNFTRVTKTADHDYAAFGQCCLSVRLNRDASALIYRSHNIRDVIWMEDQNDKLSLIARKWKPYARDLVSMFKSCSPTVVQAASKTPFMEVNCYHIVCAADLYDGDAKKFPYWSIYYDVDHSCILEAIPVWNREYIIPRWQKYESQYAYSPATIVGLPDARLIQAMTYTLLEAGEKITSPPMIATQEAIRSDVALYAGGITWVASEYDERMGDVLRPLNQDHSGMPLGVDMQRDAREMLKQAFFLNKLNMPQNGPEMTAYEVGQRIQEYIRGALPIFEPTEMDYNGQLCEMTFDVLLRGGLFGPPQNMPSALRGASIQFRFESPLHDAIEQQKGQQFTQAASLISQAMSLDQSVIALLDAPTAIRDCLSGIGVPTDWVRDEASAKEIADAQKAAAQAQQSLAAMQQGSQAAANLGQAHQSFAASGLG